MCARWCFKISDGRNIIPRIWRAAKTASMRFFLFLAFLFASFCLALLWMPMLGGRPKAAPNIALLVGGRRPPCTKSINIQYTLASQWIRCVCFLPCSSMDADAWWAAEGRPEHCRIGGRPKAALQKKYSLYKKTHIIPHRSQHDTKLILQQFPNNTNSSHK